MNKTYRIAPSILSANFATLGQEIRDVIASGTDIVHFDVMDNHYVPNLTIGPLVCEAIRPLTDAIIDVHLMVKPVDRIIPDFAKVTLQKQVQILLLFILKDLNILIEVYLWSENWVVNQALFLILLHR